ncbi:hypothetical protein [Noviherbaspirillum pedocola]|uniref:Uncharacterized protein n=1 Tax=Noviherbaspirillum pedocola TaxID=2801341 RepID=A0A934SVL9_9BURK|nr:hypothetical protein [Noviherbaspirillum pedocola]MBK4735966.1 hypothetical protein [Noviherbaspirillum pedocola]
MNSDDLDHHPTVRSLRRDIAAGEAMACYTELIALGGFRLKIAIEIDYFSLPKSSARVSVFSPAYLQWNLLASLHTSSIHHPGHHKDDAHKHDEPYRDAELYEPMRDELIQWAADILGLETATPSRSAAQ